MDAAVSWTWNELHPASAAAPHVDPEEQAAEERARQEAALEDAYIKGLEDGMAQGRNQARHELASAMAVAREAVDGIREIHQEWNAALVEQLSVLAVSIARQLVDRELAESPEILAELVQKGLAHFPKDQSVRIRVNPRDMEDISRADSSDGLTGSRPARWVADENVARGSFIIEGPERVLDGRLDKALERIYRSLTDA